MEKENPLEVGQRINQVRTSLGLTMSQFAERLNDNAKSGTVSNWENGKNLPNKQRLRKIAELGNTSVEYLLTGTPVDLDLKVTSFMMKKSSNDRKNLIAAIDEFSTDTIEKMIVKNFITSIFNIIDKSKDKDDTKILLAEWTRQLKWVTDSHAQSPEGFPPEVDEFKKTTLKLLNLVESTNNQLKSSKK